MELNEQTQKAFGVVSKEEAEEINRERSLFNKVFNPIDSRVVPEDVKNLLLDPSVADPEFDTRDLLALKSDKDFMEEYANAQNERAALKRKESENSFRNTGYDFLTERLNLDPSTAQGVVTAAEFLPFLGDLPMIEDAVDQFKRGDIKEGALTTLLATAGIAFDGVPLIVDGIKKASKPAQVFSGDFGEEQPLKNVFNIDTGKKKEVIKDANEEVLKILRDTYPDMEARSDIYKVGVLETDKGYRNTAYDITILPEEITTDSRGQKRMRMIDKYPNYPRKDKILYDPNLARVEFEPNLVKQSDGTMVDIGENKIIPDPESDMLFDKKVQFTDIRKLIADKNIDDYVDEGLLSPQEIQKAIKNQTKGKLYRGMSFEEFEEAFKNGYFKSKGKYNIGEAQKGATFFSPNPETAAMYSNDFTPAGFRATPDKPAIVIEIDAPKKGEKFVEGQELKTITVPDYNNEVGIFGEIPFSRVNKIFQGDVYSVRSNARIDITDKMFEPSKPEISVGGSVYSSDVIWQKIDMENFTESERKRIIARDFRKEYPDIADFQKYKDAEENFFQSFKLKSEKGMSKDIQDRFELSKEAYEKGFYRDFEIGDRFSFDDRAYTVKAFDITPLIKSKSALITRQATKKEDDASPILAFKKGKDKKGVDNFYTPQLIVQSPKGATMTLRVDNLYDRQGKPRFKEYKGPKEI